MELEPRAWGYIALVAIIALCGIVVAIYTAIENWIRNKKSIKVKFKKKGNRMVGYYIKDGKEIEDKDLKLDD